MPTVPAPKPRLVPASFHLPVGGILVSILVISTVLRIGLAWFLPGFVSGDDVEILEAGLDPLLRLHYQPWDLRNLLLPYALVTPTGWLAAFLGADTPLLLVRLSHLPFIALGTLNVYLVYRIARAWALRPAALLASGIYAFHWLPLGFAATVFPRTVSTTCLLLACWLLLGSGRNLARGAGAGGFLALAFAIRYGEAIFLAPLLVAAWALSPRTDRLRRMTGVLLGFAVGVCVFVGLIDLWTWGSPFHSLVAFARYTLLEHQASKLQPHQPLLWYALRAQFWGIPSLVPFLVIRKRGTRTSGLWWLFLLPVLSLSLVHHKEMRYLQGVIPFFAILVALGAAEFWRRGWRTVTVALLGVSMLFSVRRAVLLHLEKSLSAVHAALDFAAKPDGGPLFVIQAWAYGDHLFFGPHTQLSSFETAPAPEELAAALHGVSRAALYSDDLARNGALRTVLQKEGFEESKRYEVAGSRSVLTFRRPREDFEGAPVGPAPASAARARPPREATAQALPGQPRTGAGSRSV